MVSEICIRSDGEFWIASGNKAMRINKSGTYMYDTDFNGTAVSFYIRSTKLKNAQSLITETAKKGEA